MKKFVVIFILLFSQSAIAHNSNGWVYPFDCCSNTDCRPVDCETLEEMEDGSVRDTENGQTYKKDMVMSSGNHHCHVCTELGKVDGKPICAFTINGF